MMKETIWNAVACLGLGFLMPMQGMCGDISVIFSSTTNGVGFTYHAYDYNQEDAYYLASLGYSRTYPGSGTTYYPAISDSREGDIVIPPFLWGKMENYAYWYWTKVCGVGFRGFYKCRRISSVTTPDSIEFIKNEAFVWCEYMTNIVIGSSVNEIGENAFSDCYRLENVTLRGNLPTGFSASKILDHATAVRYRKRYAANYEAVIPSELFAGYVLIDDDEWLNVLGRSFSHQDGANWSGDYNVSHDGEGAMRSGAIGNDGESWIETVITNSARLSFWWKASSEEYDGEVFDYAYLSVDGVPQGTLVDYQLQGVAVGGKTGWTNVVFDIMGEGEHTIRWSYVKDEIDESDVGEDCVWLDEVSLDPLATLAFSINGGEGEAPQAISAFTKTSVILPRANGFRKAKHTFAGWSDGTETYAAGTRFVVSDTNVVFTAVWEANTLAAPVISSQDVQDGGVLTGVSATISIMAEAGTTIHYTLDGTEPTAASVSYDGPFAFDGLSATIRAIAVKEDCFDSPVAGFVFTRLPDGLADCLNAPGRLVETDADGNTQWAEVVGAAAHDGVAALQSGAIGDGEESAVSMTVMGTGQIGFWWKTSSEISRNRKYDYVAFLVDGEEQSWLGGETEWTNEVFSVSGNGQHTLSWVYRKNDNGKTQGEDCAWLDEVIWTSEDPLPEIAADSETRAVLSGAGDEMRLRASLATKTEYDAFRAWVDENGLDHQATKASVNSWVSWRLGAEALFGNEPTIGFTDMHLGDTSARSESSPLLEVSIVVKDGENPVIVASENVKNMFEATSDLGDWDGPHRLVPSVTDLTQGSGATLRFRIVPDSEGGSDRAFLRVKVK